MARYDRVYSTLARRAVEQGESDLQSFIDQAINAGMSEERIQAQLLQDLEEGGPIFGKFFRSLTGAAEASVMAASRQGETAGYVAADAELTELLRLADTPGSIIDNADPEQLAELEAEASELIEETWIAELVNTCHLCLPLHGQTKTRSEWNELGYSPDTIHASEGWTSVCHCKRVQQRVLEFALDEDRASLQQPLVRNKVKTTTGLKGSRKTARGVTQRDLERAQKARDEALQSEIGRRTLRLLGQSNA